MFDWRPGAAMFGLAVMVLGCASGGRTGATSSLALDPIWDDGKAEFSLYEGTTERYGQLRPTEARMIIVKEDLFRSNLVKSEGGPIPRKTLEALKLNFDVDFPTGTYSYHQMATVMLDRTNLEVLKETVSSTEGCGITFVRVGPRNGRLMHETHSYWEGEADREVPLVWPPGHHLYWDALPLLLRQRVVDGKSPSETRIGLLPSQIANRSPIENTRPVEARIRMQDGGTIEVPAGRFATRMFEVISPAGLDRLWFDDRFPHVLLRMETHAGRSLSLRKTMRLDYWNHHAVGDEKLLF